MKKNYIRLSIIMPVYNCENLVVKALNSFVPYMDDGMELFLVNDCSTDSSLEVLKKYIKSSDKNIVLINNNKNIGAGLSRNKCLEMANGEFIGFIDSDDYVDKEYYQNMLKMADDNNSDMVVSDITLEDEDGKYYSSIFKNNVYSTINDNNIILDKKVLLGYWGWASTCSKIFKKNLIGKNRFSKLNNDDLIFTIPLILNAKKICYCENNNYYYFQTKKSVTRTFNFKKTLEGIDSLYEVMGYLKKQKNIDYLKIYAANSLIPYLCYSIEKTNSGTIKILLDYIKKNVNKYSIIYNDLFENEYIKNNKIYNSFKYRKIIQLLKEEKYSEIISFLHKEVELPKTIYTNNNINNYCPKVSIIIPVYNGENYLSEAIDSALAQTYKNLEVIVVNDGSKDNTEKIALSYGKKINYFRKENGGVASALNLGISKMTGEYFSWLSHDDLYFNDKIEKQVNYLSHLGNKKVVLFSNYMLIDENGYQINEPIIINHDLVMKKPEYCLLRGSLNGITMLIPKECFDECGTFNLNLRCTQDYDMWRRIIKKYSFIHITDVISKTRLHSAQDSVLSPNAIREGNKLWIDMINDVSDSRKITLEGSLYNFYYKMGAHLIYSGYNEAIDYCINNCKIINDSRYNKMPLLDEKGKPYFKKKNKTEKFIYVLKTRGLKETISIIYNKIRGRV